ncbi:MAG: helix-turn-helix transcriptional regulator, partial [Thioalkalivibrio sp.]|nr:helix-turn-helix transcriptional regulator [Thioalkalivibrio sp.]
TRARILDAAEALFVEHGLEGTSMRMITGRAVRPDDILGAFLSPRLMSFLLAGLRAPLPERLAPPDPPDGGKV